MRAPNCADDFGEPTEGFWFRFHSLELQEQTMASHTEAMEARGPARHASMIGPQHFTTAAAPDGPRSPAPRAAIGARV